jgi:hypothetical protein
MPRVLALISVLAPLAAGCSGGSSDGTGSGGSGGNGEPSAGAGGSSGNVLNVCDDAPPADLADVSGRWAYLEIQTNVVRSSYMDDFITQVISLMLFEQTQTGNAFVAQASWCDRYTHEPDAVVRSVLPDGFVDALEPLTWQGTYERDSDGVWRYRTEPLYWTQGAVLDDPTDPSGMPTSPDDPNVVDQDADGHPGVTVALQGMIDGIIYVAQWNRLELDGRPVSQDRIEGLLTLEYRQSVLQSEPAFVAEVVANPVPDPDPCVSLFVLARIPDDADCAWISDQRGVLFPGIPAND